MKTKFVWTAMQGEGKRIHLGLALTFAATLSHQDAWANPAFVNLGSASSFEVLAGSGITIAGAVGSTTITGDIGTFPTTSITGLQNAVLIGVNQDGDAVTQNAKGDLVLAFNDAAGRAATQTYPPIQDLGGLTLGSGVYHDPSSFGITGTLTLDGRGNPDAVFIFQTGSTLITASDSKVVLIGGAQACHVFWEVGSSATLGTGTDFMGNILAADSITLDTGADSVGRLLAETGAVTLDNNTIAEPICLVANGAVPDAGSTLLLLSSGLVVLFAFGRRFSPGADVNHA